MANPFAGIPAGDYVRDAGAALLLFALLGKPWDLDGDASAHWWVVLSALVAVASLALPYVAKAQAVPGLGRDQAQLMKIFLNLPLLVSAVAAVVNELVHATDLMEGGIGSGVALALAGSVLALQPRAADEDVAHRDDPRWRMMTSTVSVAALVVTVATFVGFVLRDLTGEAYLFDDLVALLSLLAAPLLLTLVVLGWPVWSAVARHHAGLVVLAVVGFTFVTVDLFTSDDGSGLFGGYAVERWDTPAGGIFLVGAAAAFAISRPALRTATSLHPVHVWLLTARLALQVTALGAAVLAVSYILAMIVIEEVVGALIISVVLLGGSAVAALVGASLLMGASLNRLAFVSVALVPFVIGIIVTAVLHSSDLMVRLDPQSAPVLLSLPLLAVLALTVPPVVRQAYGPLLPERQPPTYAPAWQQPGARAAGAAGLTAQR